MRFDGRAVTQPRNLSRNTSLARLVCDEATAKRLADQLPDHFDDAETAIAAFEGTDGRWNVEVHFETAPDEAAVRRLIGELAGAGLAVTFETVAARDWVAASLAGLKPVMAGRFTVHGPHDRESVAPNRLGIEIEAALAFGTGHHGTTRGCLLAFDEVLKRNTPRRILDIGTGTGVLAIAAAKALHTRVLASDIDPESVRIARENTRLNGVAPLIDCIRAASLGAPQFKARAPFDLVFANILLEPLRKLARPLSAVIAPGGATVILSGLLAIQENAALAAYRPHGLVLVRRIPLGEWVTLVLTS
jgi:ribosomal protein L11 methyltransferase